MKQKASEWLNELKEEIIFQHFYHFVFSYLKEDKFLLCKFKSIFENNFNHIFKKF